ncbi:BRAP2 RING ZnF UBP domain-containing protein 2 [Andrographis paniculata]|uniref:BRAP2 RING ZnF UBP domain-containing protein 2 n=1 Tax=Andrographis paniculata TaxID=175694 RepID=UPI0021E7357B|nr:BRAP2 RING ZnF UBP domain-containing protein 2 [Andrographis paniculata]XP_051116329.1 BRAP2 RING ZnF UBP domain-containing protein 2 [Andrographis paniculata]
MLDETSTSSSLVAGDSSAAEASSAPERKMMEDSSTNLSATGDSSSAPATAGASSTLRGQKMFEETSTSSRIGAGDSSASATAEALHFSSGNPRIEEIRGVVHLYRDDLSRSSAQLPVERKPLVVILGVPNHMTYADFCQFCGSFIQHISEMRIVRTEGLEDRYSILIRLDEQNSADSFHKHFNGKLFSSLEEETCCVFFAVDIQYTGSIEHSQPSPPSHIDQPSCPVCLEKLDQDTSGILTTICNHSFHCSCISKWTDSSCPVCRYCQQQPEKSICYICHTSENLWMCIICGFVGCGRYKEGHAIGHWKETEHCYSLELETQRVWDYAGDNYVHRLIQSKTDGKLVELNSHCVHKNDGQGDSTGSNDTLLDSEVEFIVNEYNELLTAQLENQKIYFESLLQEVEEDTEREMSAAVEKALTHNPKLLKLQAKIDKFIEEKKFLDDIDDNLLRNESIWEAKIKEIEEREKKLLELKDKKISELEEQLRAMMACLETENAEQQSAPTTNESTVGDPSPHVAESSSSKNSSQGTSKKTSSRRKNKG